MKLKLFTNELGLMTTEDGKWGTRRVNDHSWSIQHRRNADDPWGWKILHFEETKDDAVKSMMIYMLREQDNETK